MEKEYFYNLFSSPALLSGETLSQLNQLVEEFPYFQGARVLYLQNLKAVGSDSLSSEVQKQACLIPNRQYLYWKLNPPSSLTVEPVTERDVKPVAVKPEAKQSAGEPSFVLLDENNLPDSVAINDEPNSGVSDTDILEFIDGDLETDSAGAKDNDTPDLIDAFLTANPKIERPTMLPRGEVVDIEDVSLSSIAEPEEVASEPLAQIFVAQGYFEKAIAVYEKLCLKYPEKNSYFADQIKKIKEIKS
ncbi:MAG: hypothetical protein H6536_01265 [Bacteroidales bacterium]|nr:hypothetical protein [Bacteroidales bacterium]